MIERTYRKFCDGCGESVYCYEPRMEDVDLSSPMTIIEYVNCGSPTYAHFCPGCAIKICKLIEAMRLPDLWKRK